MATQRLPIPGQDDGTWGDILNGFLGVEHDSAGNLKIRTDGTVPILSNGKVPATNLGSGTASSSNYLRGDGTWAVPSAGVILDATVADIQPDTTTGNAVIGSTGKAADAGHQHALVSHDHTTSNKGGQIPVAGLSASGTASSTTFLRGDGSWAAPATGALPLAPTAVKANSDSPVSANPGDFIPVDTTSGAVTVTLPLAPADKSRIEIKLIAQTGTNSVTINTGGGSDVFNKTSGTTTASLTLLNQAITLQYAVSGAIWYVVGDDIPLAQLDTRYLMQTNAAGIDTPGLYIPGANPLGGRAWGANLLTKLNAGQPGVIAGHGDSLMQGMYASVLRTKSWFGLLTGALQSKWGDGGSGFFGTMNSSTVLTALGTVSAAVTTYGTNDLWALIGTWTGTQSSGAPGWQGVSSSASGDTATTPAGAIRGRYIDVLTNNVTGFTYAIDGGSGVAVSGLVAANENVTTVDTGSVGTHTIAITTTTTGMKLFGVVARNTTGIRLDKWATYGQKTAMFANSGAAGLSGGAISSAPIKADMLVYGLFANDAAQAVASEASVQNITIDLNAFQTSIYSGTSQGAVDILFVLPHMGRFDSSTPMRNALKSRITAFCRSEGYAYVDLHAFGHNSWDWMNTQGYWANSAIPGSSGTDNVHLGDAGHVWYEQQVGRPFQAVGLL